MLEKVSSENANGRIQSLRTTSYPHLHLSLVKFPRCFIQNKGNCYNELIFIFQQRWGMADCHQLPLYEILITAGSGI